MIYGRDSNEAENKAWQKLSKEISGNNHAKAKVKSVLSRRLHSTLEKQKEVPNESILLKKTEGEVFSDQQQLKAKEVSSQLIPGQTKPFPFLQLPKDLLSLIFQQMDDKDAFGSCIKVCKLFKECLEGLREFRNKELLRSELDNNFKPWVIFNEIGILENISNMPQPWVNEIFHFYISRNHKKGVFELKLNEKRPLPSEKITGINSLLEKINKENDKKKQLAKPSEEIYKELITYTEKSMLGCFDKAGRFINLGLDSIGKIVWQVILARNTLGMWEVGTVYIANLKLEHLFTLEKTVNKFNNKIKKPLEFARDMLYPLFKSEVSEIWGRFNRKDLLEILDVTGNQDIKKEFQFKMQKNDLDVWELALTNVKKPLTPQQELALKFIRTKFNTEEIIWKEKGIWKEIRQKSGRQITEKEKLFFYEFDKFSDVKNIL